MAKYEVEAWLMKLDGTARQESRAVFTTKKAAYDAANLIIGLVATNDENPSRFENGRFLSVGMHCPRASWNDGNGRAIVTVWYHRD